MVASDNDTRSDGDAFHRLVSDSQLLLRPNVEQLDPHMPVAAPEIEDGDLARPVARARKGSDDDVARPTRAVAPRRTRRLPATGGR